ncbi:hypothetical protein IMG5_193920 [Ichthyophthirius multifiliis]|uniref:Uncharacterized protein n=1 Tax=Ichthyophthirius multifiliis TaxID=5932 RepID=G0R4N2_ICHMU|nr:hypothetical protein IMG5_193920 [Ichthyophthirius multifiliis]EGR27592.1 hypothetical protein IMG5_193920 [Ichthyophthirius multifiliis]|eukprot:XP_004025044.1 hypothetical protein IMG5_193920 [Ichthyophthirius multifiliis]
MFKEIALKQLENVKKQVIKNQVNIYAYKTAYVHKLAKLSELCIVGGIRISNYASELCELCVEILGAGEQVWKNQFQLALKEQVIDCVLEYFVQNCVIAIETNTQIQKILLMSLAHLSCIDYPKNQEIQSLGLRCINTLKRMLQNSNKSTKELIEKSILEVIIQNIKVKNWTQLQESSNIRNYFFPRYARNCLYFCL